MASSLHLFCTIITTVFDPLSPLRTRKIDLGGRSLEISFQNYFFHISMNTNISHLLKVGAILNNLNNLNNKDIWMLKK
jgi:hypothetical protein